VRPTLRVRSVDEFVAPAKANPDQVSFGVQGLGGEMHLAVEMFKKSAGVSFTLVPYNAAANAIVDLLAAMLLVIPPIKGHIEAGKLIPLAALSAEQSDDA
jgi:tripartite-type tricarboxylate transporter receptor subunit TctC